ncbi:MAG TPA: tripartite tricarboxylate transporter substrate binding protein, partial [Burkholderiaceae bacterium]|nr:tripartite tricarboxylate transporter substrate binding protein [Burkholderiaceae bacterium]
RMAFKVDDLMPVSIATEFSQVLVCYPQLGVKTLAELIDKARATTLNYASGGAGVPGHMAMELLLSAAGVSMTHVPYKGPALAMQDVMAGQLPCGFLAGPTVLPQVKAGKLVALAISGAKRSPLAPEIPTVAEAGFPGYDATFYLVLYTRPGVPQPIVERFSNAFVDALRAPEVVARMQAIDQQIVGSAPAEAAQRLAATSRKWSEVVRRIDLKLD